MWVAVRSWIDGIWDRKFKRVLITGIAGAGGSYLAEYINNTRKNVKIYVQTLINGNFHTKSTFIDRNSYKSVQKV